MNILLGEIFVLAETMKKETTFEDFVAESKAKSKEVSYEDFEKSKEEVLEMIKVTLPIALQHVILENIGTPKLEIAINELMCRKKDKPFEKFMLEFLKCDLGLGNLKTELHRYIEKENSQSVLKLIFMKLLFYYRMRFFGTNNQIYIDIVDLMIEVQIKLAPSDNEKLNKTYKGNKESVRKDVVRRLEKINL